MPPTIICTDNPNDIIKKVSNNTFIVSVNIIKDKSSTGKSNNYYDNIDNKILQSEYEGTIMFEGVEDAEESNTKNVTTTNGNNNINMTCQLAQEEKWTVERKQCKEDRVERTRVWEEERALERAQQKEDRANRGEKRGHYSSTNYY